MWGSKRDTDVYNSLLDSVGEDKDGMIWENSIETHIVSYVKQIANPGSMHETWCSELVHWDDPEGWDGERGGSGCSGGGTHVHPWLIHVNVWQKPLQYCNYPPIKIKKENIDGLCTEQKYIQNQEITECVQHIVLINLSFSVFTLVYFSVYKSSCQLFQWRWDLV